MPGAKVVPLSRDSHVAMYRQLAQRRREAVARGDYKPGDRISTEPELVARYRVSRITCRQAVEALAREGLVIRKQGKGTFVAGPLVHHDLLNLKGIYDGLVEQGLVPVTRLLDFSRAPPPAPVAARLGTGDTIAALHKFGITGRIGYISTAGGAFLEFLKGKTLPAVAALEARA